MLFQAKQLKQFRKQVRISGVALQRKSLLPKNPVHNELKKKRPKARVKKLPSQKL
jgi:hypothetical protein